MAGFYETPPEASLRLGDVVVGFTLTEPDFTPSPGDLLPNRYRVLVEHPSHCVIMSPCCSIKGGAIALSPLLQIKKSWFDNDYFAADFTMINSLMSGEQAVGPQKWQDFSAAERQQKLDMSPGGAYAEVGFFIYPPNDLLPTYPMTCRQQDRTVGHYMVDFGRIYRVKCPKIKKAGHLKKPQLSIDARSQLRDKISHYFGRPPAEDKV